MADHFTVQPSERVLIVGPSGSGKSTVARALTAGYRRMVVIDAKHEETLARSVTIRGVDGFTQTWPQRSPRVLFQPDPDRQGADVDDVIRRVMHYGRTALIVHDAQLFATSRTILPALRAAQITGRSIGVTVWCLVQRPVDVHNVLLSEATHLLIFPLALESDRQKLAGIVGPEALRPPGVPFSFDYYGPSTGGRLVRCSPLEVNGAPTDDRQPGPGHDHGPGRHLRDKGSEPNVSRSGPGRPGRRRLA